MLPECSDPVKFGRRGGWGGKNCGSDSISFYTTICANWFLFDWCCLQYAWYLLGPCLPQGSAYFRLFRLSGFLKHIWTILEISANLKRIFFEGVGVVVFEYSDPKWHWNASFATPKAKKFLGEDPQTPLKTGYFVSRSLTNICTYYQARHYALSGFFVLSQADPCCQLLDNHFPSSTRHLICNDRWNWDGKLALAW